MKKYLVLTSVLALTACGGGSGSSGAGADVNTVVVPGDLAGRVTATDNDVITKMKSEVIVASNSDNPLSRKATVEKDGVTFASYRLEDIRNIWRNCGAEYCGVYWCFYLLLRLVGLFRHLLNLFW